MVILAPMKRAAMAVLSVVAVGAAAFSFVGSATAFPSSSPDAIEGAARLDAMLKPPFHALIHPRLRHRYNRPAWAPYWGGPYYGGYDPCAPGYGSGGYPGGGGGGYVDGAYPPSSSYPQTGYPGTQRPSQTYPGAAYPSAPYSGGSYPSASPYPTPSYSAGPYPTAPGSSGGYVLDGRYISVGGGGPYNPQAYNGCQGGYSSGYPSAPSWGWNPSSDISTWGPPNIYPLGGGTDHITVDCRDQSGPRLNMALAQLAPGGTLYLKGRGPACEESLQIQQPVIIAGEPPAAFPMGADPGQAVIKAPPGQPCAIIAVGPRGGVEFRDVTLDAPQGGASPCIQSWGSAVALIRSTIHHSGEASAVYASGGQLFFSDAEIDGVSEDSTIWVEDAAIVFKNVGVTAVSTALDIRPGGANSVLLDHVSLYAPPGESAHTATGLLARRSHTLDGHFELHHVSISGFRNGIVLESGVDAKIDSTLISHARLGLAVDGAKVDIHDSGIDALDWGVYAYAGQVTIARTHLFSFARLPIGSDPGAVIDDHDIYAYSDHCGGLFGHEHDRWSCRDRRTLGPQYQHSDFTPHHWGWN